MDAESVYLFRHGVLREVGSRLHEGVALGNLDSVLDDLGRHDEAVEAYRQAIDIHRQTGNRRFVGIHSGALAGTTRKAGRPEEARRLLVEALAIVGEAGDKAVTEQFKAILATWDEQD